MYGFTVYAILLESRRFINNQMFIDTLL